MTFPKGSNRRCMRLVKNRKFISRKQRKTNAEALPIAENNKGPREQLAKNQIDVLLFDNCINCGKMAAIPQGAFAVCKVRLNQNRGSSTSEKGKEKCYDNIYNAKLFIRGIAELTPLQYNSKLMNSIWGLYNRYSVHNFKKNTDGDSAFLAAWGAFLKNRPPTATATIAAGKNP